jgi:glycosyltransferase involved in cell wall biosynthesis
MNESLVSVIIPIYNGEAFIGEALDSILAQAYTPLEIILVDDGSTDETAQVIHTWAAQRNQPVCYVRQENGGPAAARNHGLRLSRGEVIAFQDADDVWALGRLATQLDLLDCNPMTDLALGQVQFFRTGGKDAETPGMTLLGMPRRFPVIHSALYRRKVFNQVGLLNVDMRYHEDIEWFYRAQKAGVSLCLHDDVVLFYRRHAANMTNDRAQLQRAWLPFLSRLRFERSLQADPLWAWLTGKM